ncbi:MAG: helix-turn-helix transcriptional regulator [Phycisphaerae bacterium]
MLFNSKQWTYLQRGYHLTPRELQIARLVCEGLEHDQIAKERRIKYNTVRAHLGNICRKVAVKGKTGLILQFLKVVKSQKKE